MPSSIQLRMVHRRTDVIQAVSSRRVTRAAMANANGTVRPTYPM